MNLTTPVKMPQNTMIALPFTQQGQQPVVYNNNQANLQPTKISACSKEFHFQATSDEFLPKKNTLGENSTYDSVTSNNSGSIKAKINIENIPPYGKSVE